MAERHFEDEELIWPDINPKWTQKELLQQYGMFRFSKIRHFLGIETKHITNLSKKVKNSHRLYHELGIKKPFGSQYIIRMSRFAKTYKERLVKTLRLWPDSDSVLVLQLPTYVQSANQLAELEGYYYLKDIIAIEPFTGLAESIRKEARTHKSPQEAWQNCGVWLNPSRKFIVELPRFYVWFLEKVWHQ